MSTISIDFSYDDNVKRSINKAKNSLQSRVNDYYGIKRNLSGIQTSTSNLSTANSYIQKKINTLESKYNKLDRFYSAVTTFNDNAYSADKSVAKRINTETKQFYKRENIAHGILYTIGCVLAEGGKWLVNKYVDRIKNVIDFVSSTAKTIKKWYEENKYWIDVLVDAVLVATAVVAVIFAPTTIALIFAFWGLAKAGADLIFDSFAYAAYTSGDMEKYEELSESGLKDAMKATLGPFGECLYYGMEIASVVYSVYKIGTAAKKIFTNYKCLYKNDHLLIAKLSDGTKQQIIKSSIKDVVLKSIGITNLDPYSGKLNGLEGIRNINSAINWTAKTFNNVMNSESFGSFVWDSISITSNLEKGYTNIKDLINRVATMKFNVSANSTVNPAVVFV